MKRCRIRKIIAFLAVMAVLVLSGSTSAVIVNGQWVIFTIANDELLPLSYNTMPYMYKQRAVCPIFRFYRLSGSAIGIQLQREEVLILGNSERTLFYDMKKRDCIRR